MTTIVPSKTPTIFGREPAAWVGLIEALLTLLLAFSLINQEIFGPIMAVVVAAAGVLVAYLTKDTSLAVILGLAKAVIALVVTLAPGLNLTDVKAAAILGVVSLVFSLFQRTQTSPVGAAPAPQEVVLQLPSGLPTAPADQEVASVDESELPGLVATAGAEPTP